MATSNNNKKKKVNGQDDNPIIGQSQSPLSGMPNRLGLFSGSTLSAPSAPPPANPMESPVIGLPSMPPGTGDILAQRRKKKEESPMFPQRRGTANRRMA